MNISTPHITRYSEKLYLIDLDQPLLTGFRQFIACWLYKSDQLTFVVDPGPASTIPVLLEGLMKLQVDHLDFILLTHIHLDHGGGAGHLVKHFPQAKISCHPKGIPHLLDPEKLWQGSLDVLGDTARAFGPLKAVAAEQVFYEPQIRQNGHCIDVIQTPGHAAHHMCYLFDGILFVAEAAGVNLRVGSDFYQRIATPPRFIYDVYKSSLEKAADLQAKHLCFGHHGMRSDGKAAFDTARKQLDLWMEVVGETVKSGTYEEIRVLNELLKIDPALQAFKDLADDKQQREHYFCRNSIRGIYNYCQESLA